MAVTSDTEVDSLCAAMGTPGEELAANARLATVIGRGDVVDRLEAAVGAWTATRSADEVVGACQAEGVPAATVMTASRLLTDDQLWERGFYHLIEREEIDPNFIPGAVIRLTSTPGGPTCPPPLFGQHTDDVLREVLRAVRRRARGTRGRRRHVPAAERSELALTDPRSWEDPHDRDTRRDGDQ